MPDSSRTVVFCLPGNSFPGKFVECWTNLLAWCMANNIRPVLSRQYSCNIYYVRNMCLGADVTRGPQQKPFDGKLAYDFLLWVDADIVFRPEHLARLLSHDTDIVSGLYLMEGGREFATVKEWDEEFFNAHGHFQFLTPVDVKAVERKSAAQPVSSTPHSELATPHLLAVAYTGMGFMLVKRGVFEALSYPWFRPMEKRIGNMCDFTMEDVAFCLRAKEAGYTVYVDPEVRVGHVKSVVL